MVDRETAPQAFEFRHAMTTLGAPAKLIVYADVLEQTVAWFARYL